MKVTVVIPTWNEAGCIESVISEIPRDVVDEIIVVDGHSTDGTAEIVKRIDGVTLLIQDGKGFGSAIAQGFKAAGGDAIVVLDGDGSHNPADIPKLVDKIDEGYDYVMAARYRPGSRSEDDTFVRYFGNMFFTFLVNVLYKTNISDSLYLFTCIRRTALSGIKLRSRGFEFCVELLVKAHKAGLKIAEVPSNERPRYSGASKVNAFRHGIVILFEILRARKY
jgi:glycosyltransferase involved in cell wall biosynthesis